MCEVTLFNKVCEVTERLTFCYLNTKHNVKSLKEMLLVSEHDANSNV